jgi:hypothetical protein
MRFSRSQSRIAVIIGCITSLFLLADLSYNHRYRLSSAHGLVRWWTPYYFSDPPPSWLTPPKPSRDSLRIRMAIISHPAEFEKRMAMRLNIVQGVPHTDVDLTYVFMIGIPERPQDWPEAKPLSPEVVEAVQEEARRWNDLHFLNIGEGRRYMGEKRWMMLQWASSGDLSDFDLYLSADTDSFIRIAALARRLHYLRPGVDFQTHPLFWGHMLDYRVHWSYHPRTPSADDPSWEGANYRYPAGMAFLLSSALVHNLTASGVELPRHISYNRDDVMHGMWVADFAPRTDIVDDPAGFHEPPPTKGWRPVRPIDYEAVCLHHLSPAQIYELRHRPEYEKTYEWDLE